MNPSSTTGWTWIPIPSGIPIDAGLARASGVGQGLGQVRRENCWCFRYFPVIDIYVENCWNCVVPWFQVERKRCVKFNEKTGRGWVCKETPVSCWILWSLWKHSRVATPWDNQPCNMQELWATSIEIGQRLHLEIGNDAGRPLLDRFLSLCNYSKRNLYGGCI